ncbi:unnamed protein product, partial [Amoebophrya sp. A120]
GPLGCPPAGRARPPPGQIHAVYACGNSGQSYARDQGRSGAGSDKERQRARGLSGCPLLKEAAIVFDKGGGPGGFRVAKSAGGAGDKGRSRGRVARQNETRKPACPPRQGRAPPLSAGHRADGSEAS